MICDLILLLFVEFTGLNSHFRRVFNCNFRRGKFANCGTGEINMLIFTRLPGRALVYGGVDVNTVLLSSVEMLSVDGRAWQTLPTRMFVADS